MKWSTSGPSRWAMATVGPILLATAFSTAFAADSPLVGAWQLDPGQPGQAGLYLFTPTRYSMVLAATDRPDIGRCYAPDRALPLTQRARSLKLGTPGQSSWSRI